LKVVRRPSANDDRLGDGFHGVRLGASHRKRTDPETEKVTAAGGARTAEGDFRQGASSPPHAVSGELLTLSWGESRMPASRVVARCYLSSAMALTDLAEQLHRVGARHLASALDRGQLSTLLSSLHLETAAGAVRGRSRSAYGARGLLVARPHLPSLFSELMLDCIAEDALGGAAFPIDAIFFDKRSDANWAVPAHQDVVVPVPFNAGLAGVRNRRHRHGLTYGEPADHVLQELVALRVHFDDAGPENGGLSIVHGSHSLGRLSGAEILRIHSESYTQYDCRTGDVLLMKPLAVHRSGRSVLPTHRRVLQVLYGPREGWHARASENAA
jgi:hypothetical protein